MGTKKKRTPDTTLGQRMQIARFAAGLQPAEVAAALGLSKQAISHWEVGRSDPQLEKLQQIATLYRCSLDWLILGKGSLQGAMQTQHDIVSEFPTTMLSREDLRQEFTDTITTLRQAGVQIGRVTILPAGTIQIDSVETATNGGHARKLKRAKEISPRKPSDR